MRDSADGAQAMKEAHDECTELLILHRAPSTRFLPEPGSKGLPTFFHQFGGKVANRGITFFQSAADARLKAKFKDQLQGQSLRQLLGENRLRREDSLFKQGFKVSEPLHIGSEEGADVIFGRKLSGPVLELLSMNSLRAM